MTDDAIIIEALAMRLVEIRPGGEVWRVATRSRTGRVIPLPAAKRADPIDSSTGYRRVKLGKYVDWRARALAAEARWAKVAPLIERLREAFDSDDALHEIAPAALAIVAATEATP